MSRLFALLFACSISISALPQSAPDSLWVSPDSMPVLPPGAVELDGVPLDSLGLDTLFMDAPELDVPDSLALDSARLELAPDSLAAPADTIAADTLLPDTIITELPPSQVVHIDPMDTITRAYLERIEALARARDAMQLVPAQAKLDPYYSQMLLPPTYFRRAIHGALTTRDTTHHEPKAVKIRQSHQALIRAYLYSPWLVRQTEMDLAGAGTLRHDITEQTIHVQEKLSERLPEELGIEPELHDTVVVVTRRPNFWQTNGRTTVGFSQNYSSDNWGGDDSYSGIFTLNANANYNNQRKFTWNNSLSMELGFQTAKGDSRRTFRPTNNVIRYTTNVGYQLWKSISYSSSVQMNTKLVPTYNANSDVCNSDILSPLDVTISVGLSYGFNVKNKGKFTGSIGFAPVAYSIRYCSREKLAPNFGIRPGHQSSHSWGPNINVNATWNIAKNVRWSTRVYWFSNLSMTRIEWENNFFFTLSKYINAQLQVYPRIDDSAAHYKNKHGKYIMMKEWFNIGMNYSF